MELGRALYEKYKGRTAKGLFGAEGPIVGWVGSHLLMDVGSHLLMDVGSKSCAGWKAYEGYESIGGTVHLPECGGAVFTYVNIVGEDQVI